MSNNLLALEQFNLNLKKNCYALELLSNAEDIGKHDGAFLSLLWDRTCELKQLLGDYDTLLECMAKDVDMEF